MAHQHRSREQRHAPHMPPRDALDEELVVEPIGERVPGIAKRVALVVGALLLVGTTVVLRNSTCPAQATLTQVKVARVDGTYMEAGHAATWITRFCGVPGSFNSKVFERTWAKDESVFQYLGKLRKDAAAKLAADRRAGIIESWNNYVAARRARGWFTDAERAKISADARGVARVLDVTPDTIVDVKVFNMGQYEPLSDRDSETGLMNVESQSVGFALKDLWEMESRLDSENFRPEWVSQVSSRLAWVDKLPLALPVSQAEGDDS